MKRTDLLPSLIIAGMALGTAWAVRGQFGHEHGAAWAGGIGCLTILLLSGRKDWLPVSFQATLAGALGWGLGGIMSYGKVVGYGRGVDFGNVYYGLLMLFVIGALYGFLGGGLFGISLSNEGKRKGIRWHSIMVEMTIGAILVYFFVVEQFGWLMTPPRSELWAACLGMASAIAWFMVRLKMYSALRVAVLTSLGAGFGFSFGNFLQVIGNVSGVKFNFWNVMEYSLGFFGGVAMAYGVFTSEWKEKQVNENQDFRTIPLLVLLLIIPAIMWQQNTGLEKLHGRFTGLVTDLPLFLSKLVNWGPYFLFALLSYLLFKRSSGKSLPGKEEVYGFYKQYFGVYILLSILITGAFLSTYRIEQYLYLVNFGIILYFLPRLSPPFKTAPLHWRQYAMNCLWILIFVAILAVIASNSHEADLGGANYRFGEMANPDRH